jgi:serine/threonine-protein kinase RsbW
VIFLRVPAHLSYRELVIRAAELACKVTLGQGDSEFCYQLMSAAGEAFNNVAMHAFDPARPGEVEVRIQAAGGAFELELLDQGKSFDLDAVTAPDFTVLPESGMGLYIMRQCVDEVHYRPGPPNVLLLRKRYALG